MKRILTVLLTAVLIFSLSACGKDKGSTDNSKGGTSNTDVTSSEIISTGSSSTDTSSADSTASVSSGSGKTVSYVTSEITVKKPNPNIPANTDRSWHENPAGLCFPVTGTLDNEADEMRSKILSSNGSGVKITGTTYYVSEKGDDSNDGKSPKTAWATPAGAEVHNASLKSGDAVLFERGGVFRGSMKLASGVYYGAYGTGDRPCIYGSARNFADAVFTSDGKNVWRLREMFAGDVGIIVFNHGEAVGNRVSSRAELKSNYDFFCDTSDKNRVYLYFEEDPSKVFISIEIGADSVLFRFDGQKNITIENLTFKYTGGHAVRGSNTENITVRNCEIGYVGGSYLDGYGDGKVRYGNGIELMSNSKNTLLENNWIYQIYDSGITHQGDNCVVENFTAKNNLIEFCGMGAIEYWHTKGAVIKSVLYEGNMLRFAGYGFGGLQRPDKNMSAAIQSNAKPTGSNYNYAESFIIRNNIFELSTYQLVNAASAAGTPPILDGNTYIQVDGRWLGYYGKNTNIRFNKSSELIIKNTWNDASAKLAFA